MLTFATPYALLLLLATPFLLVGATGDSLLRLQRSVNGIRFASIVPFPAYTGAGRLRERMWILNLLRSAAFVTLVIALARPQAGTSFVESEASGRDIMIAMDTSGSMNALDFFLDGQRVDRLTALKQVVKKFIEGRKGDRMGLVVFGSEVFTQCPLSLDHSVLKELTDGLQIGMAGEGTALGDALVIAVKRLRDIKADSRVIVLVTDGVKTAGSVEPKAAAEVAKQAGMKVYTIGIGGNKPAPFRVTGVFGEPRLEYRPVELDQKTLKEIADMTGGRYFNAQKTETLEEVYKEISKLEERVEKTYEYYEYRELYLPFLIFGFCCFLLHELLAATRYLIVP